jgi:hypothetical protein
MTTSSTRPVLRQPLTRRHRALLRAVAAGRCQVTRSRVPDLFIDNRCSCDQHAVHELATAGFIRPAVADGRPGELVPAVLTPAGREALQ